MTAKASDAKTVKEERTENSTLLKDLIESQVSKEKEVINDINAGFNSKRKVISNTYDLKEAMSYLQKEKKTYDSYIARLDMEAEHRKTVGARLRKEIAQNALKKFPGLNEITRLSYQNITQLHDALHPGPSKTAGVFDRDLLDLGVLLPDLFEYEVFEAPYALSDAYNVGVEFDEDFSSPWKDWGTLHHNVKFSVHHSWTDFSGSAYKYANNSVAVGVNYRMPERGELEITVVLKNIDNLVDIKIADNFGPSGASLDISNMIFIPVSLGI